MACHLVYGAGRCRPSRSRPIVPGDRGSLQLLGRLLGERVQFTAASRDPLQLRRSVRSASPRPSAGRAWPPTWSWRWPLASVPATRGPSCTPPRATPTPSGCTSCWASGCATARRSSRRGCRRQRGSSNADVRTSGGRSPPRLDVHSTHGSHMRSEGVPVPGRSCPVPVRRVRDGRRPGERVGDLLSRVARPRLAIPGNSRYFPDHSVACRRIIFCAAAPPHLCNRTATVLAIISCFVIPWCPGAACAPTAGRPAAGASSRGPL